MKTVITLYSLSVQIETEDERLEELINRFIDTAYQSVIEPTTEDGKPVITCYASKIVGYSSYTITNKQFSQLIGYLAKNGVDIRKSDVVYKRDYDVEQMDYKVRPNWELREKQIAPYRFVMMEPSGCKLLPLATGTGKTFISLYILAQLQQRFAILIEPKFIDKWIDDIIEVHDATKDDIVIIQGSETVKDIINHAKDGTLKYKYIIISIPTFRNFITSFEQEPDYVINHFGITPYEFFKLLKVGTILVDEIHLSYNAVFRAILFSGVKFLLGLSATLIPNSELDERAYNALFSEKDIYHDSMIVKYLDVFLVSYDIDSSLLRKLRWKVRGGPMNGAYNHNTFEQSIMKNKNILKSYIKIIVGAIQEHYIDRYILKDKCIIFVSSKKMATILTEKLKLVYPDKDIKRYIESDSYQEMLEGDIIVTTVISAGTGIDIPNLRVGIQTESIGSPKRNIQASGRLRLLKDRDVRYICLYSPRIDKQRDYNRARKKIYADRVANIYNAISRYHIE